MTRKTPENDFMRQVMNLAKMRGWKVAHFGASVRIVGKNRVFVGDQDSAGFPDLVMVRRNRVIFAELKAPNGKVSDAQFCWLEALRAARAETFLWRPDDWTLIQETLK